MNSFESFYLIHELQNDSSSQEFYSKTVTALEKKKSNDAEVDRRTQGTKDVPKSKASVSNPHVQKPLSSETEKGKPHAEIEVPKRLPSEKPISGKAPSDNRPPEDKMDGERTVAGRKLMKGKEKQKPISETAAPSASSKSAAKGEEKAAATKSEKVESKEDHEVETEINSILKKGPSKCSNWGGEPGPANDCVLKQSSYSQRPTVPTLRKPNAYS